MYHIIFIWHSIYGMSIHVCSACKQEFSATSFSKAQKKKALSKRKCMDCAVASTEDAHRQEDAIVSHLLSDVANELPEVEPDSLRQQAIVAEVERRRALSGNTGQQRLREKSDAIFGRFDLDCNGFLNYKEISLLGAATGGEIPEIAFGSICEEINEDPTHGISSNGLFKLYTTAGMGDADRDFNMIFRAAS